MHEVRVIDEVSSSVSWTTHDLRRRSGGSPGELVSIGLSVRWTRLTRAKEGRTGAPLKKLLDGGPAEISTKYADGVLGNGAVSLEGVSVPFRSIAESLISAVSDGGPGTVFPGAEHSRIA